MTSIPQGFAMIPRSMLYDQAIPPDAKIIYLVVSSHIGGNETAWPSRQRIADLSGVSLSTAKRQLGWLERHGYIEVVRRKVEQKQNLTNEYRLIVGTARIHDVEESDEGGVTQTLGPDNDLSSDDDGSQGTEGGVTQTRGVGSQGTPNESQLNESQGRTDAPATAVASAPQAQAPEPGLDLNRRAQLLAKHFYDLRPMSNFPATMEMCKKAIRAGHADEAIEAALTMLAQEGRTLTVETLRIQLEGAPGRQTELSPRERVQRDRARAAMLG